ncbi:hypothetical protein Anapl_08610 [Anas platyrhynchos]|uniref:Uncharacterized protein n=1 Tax=Anas platyrhynchos TaxID=8839 RepID=R0LZX9_ANAPL|nr:hypothetical protein Anapl_08610 [Anas platyrhynchos]
MPIALLNSWMDFSMIDFLTASIEENINKRDKERKFSFSYQVVPRYLEDLQSNATLQSKLASTKSNHRKQSTSRISKLPGKSSETPSVTRNRKKKIHAFSYRFVFLAAKKVPDNLCPAPSWYRTWLQRSLLPVAGTPEATPGSCPSSKPGREECPRKGRQERGEAAKEQAGLLKVNLLVFQQTSPHIFQVQIRDTKMMPKSCLEDCRVAQANHTPGTTLTTQQWSSCGRNLCLTLLLSRGLKQPECQTASATPKGKAKPHLWPQIYFKVISTPRSAWWVPPAHDGWMRSTRSRKGPRKKTESKLSVSTLKALSFKSPEFLMGKKYLSLDTRAQLLTF